MGIGEQILFSFIYLFLLSISEFDVVMGIGEQILFSLIFVLFFLFWVSLNLMYFDLKCDAECNGVNVGCLGVSVIDAPYNA